MSTYNHKSKRNKGHSFVGLIIVLLLSIATLLWLTNKPVENLLTKAQTTPILQLNTNDNSHNNDINSTGNENINSNDNSTDNNDLLLINKQNPIPDNYKVDLVELANGQSVDRHIYPALQDMFDTARAQGIYPVVVSGYRTAEKQQSLMDEKISAYTAEGYDSSEAVKKAKEWVATPGTSEHQLGLAIDINADGVNSSGDEVYTWLAQNAHTFGFICRYPTDKADITGISYEPWHYRYVGVAAATQIHQQGVCLEEYLNAMD